MHQSTRNARLAPGHLCSSLRMALSAATPVMQPSMQTGNSVAWISVRLLALLQRSFNFMLRSLFNFQFNVQFNFQFSFHSFSEQWCTDLSSPPALVSVWQGRWRTANFDIDITVCHLSRFPLIRRNNWQTVAMCFFVLEKF
jgi:hypothetical protein